MDTYNLQDNLFLSEVYHEIEKALRGYGYAIIPYKDYKIIGLGEGVNLSIQQKPENEKFTWNISIIKILEKEIGGMILFAIMFVIASSGILLTHYYWTNLLLIIVCGVLFILNIFILLFKPPIAIVSSKIHLLKTQILLKDIIEKYNKELGEKR